MTSDWQRNGTTYALTVEGRGTATITPKCGEFLLVVAREGGKTDYVFRRSVEELQGAAEERLGVGRGDQR